MQLDKDDPLALAHAAQVYSYVLEEPETGSAFAARAVALDPNLVMARLWAGWAQVYLGNVDAAIEQFSAAVRLSPIDPHLFLPQTGMAYAHYFAGRHEEGLSWATSAIQRQPNLPGAQRILMSNLAMAGRIAEARRACDAILQAEADRIQNTKRHFEPDDKNAFDEAHLVPWGAALELVMRTIARMLARCRRSRAWCGLTAKLRGISHFWLYLPVDQSVS
jgi:tetratricopeptide (TPR) repeat protein